MPNNIVQSFAKKTHLSVEKIESLWNRAKKIAEKEGKGTDYDYIVGILKKSLKMNEAELKEVELFLGRFQPLHNGHATVIGKMKNAVVALVKGEKTSDDASKNPLTSKDQARLIKKAFPGTVIMEVPNGYIPDIGRELRRRGMELTAVWAGEDRRSSYERQLRSFNEKHPDEKFDITVKKTFEGGQRIGGTSATLVRNAIRTGNKEEFLKHMPKKLHSEWEFLRKKIK